LDCALRHFCGEGDLKWVSHSCGREAARSGGPSLEKEYTEDPKRYTSGIVLETEVQPTLPTGVSL